MPISLSGVELRPVEMSTGYLDPASLHLAGKGILVLNSCAASMVRYQGDLVRDRL